jgi:hypothetical protein
MMFADSQRLSQFGINACGAPLHKESAITESQQTYAYPAGKKVLLEKQPDWVEVRVQPEELQNIGITDAERVSSASSRITVRAGDLEPMMSCAQHIENVGKGARWGQITAETGGLLGSSITHSPTNRDP